MRTFLTYVLAASAAAGAGYLALLVTDPLRTLSIADGIIGLIFYSILAGLIAGPVWALVDLLRVRAFHIEGHMWSIPQGVLVFLAPAVAVSMIFAAYTDLQYPSRSSSFMDYLGEPLLGLIVAGAAWGAVFWIRAPKPTSAGAAA